MVFAWLADFEHKKCLKKLKFFSVVCTSVNLKNKTFWIVMLSKLRPSSNFGSLNPNLKWVFTYDSSIANFRVANFSVSGNPEIGNTVAVGENPCQIRTQRPKITI